MDINLSALGVPLQEQRGVPDIYSIPMQCNPSADKIWREAVSGVKAEDPATAWSQAIKKFIDLCSKADVFPFQEQKTNNDKIYNELVTARHTLVKFMNKHEIYKAFKPRRVQLKVTMLAQGFVIKGEARADLLEKDPKLIHTFGVFDNMGLRKAGPGHAAIWQRNLGQGVRFFVANEGARMTNRWSFGYEIAVPVFPSIPGNYTPSNKELETFVLDIIYASIVRSIRPFGVMNRLI